MPPPQRPPGPPPRPPGRPPSTVPSSDATALPGTIPPRPRPPPPRAPPPRPPTNPPPRAPTAPPPRPPGEPPSKPSAPPSKNAIPAPPSGAPASAPRGAPPKPPASAPPEVDDDASDSATPPPSPRTIEKLVRRGRLHFKLLEARGLRKHGGSEKKKFSADVYIKIRLGSHPMTSQDHRTTTIKKCMSANVQFSDAELAFDLTDPKSMVTDGDLPIKLQVYDENLLSDELLGETTFSALRFFDGKAHMEVLPLTLMNNKDRPHCGDIELEVRMEVALIGMISIILLEGRNLKSMELIGKQDPYCRLAINNVSKRSKTISKGGKNPLFDEEEIVFWITPELWVSPVHFSVFDEDIGSDDLIGEATFSVLHFMTHAVKQALDIPIALKNRSQNAGEVLTKIQFFPAGELTIRCLAGKDLRNVDVMGRQDPYVRFTLEGIATKITSKTKTDTDGGREPEWENEVFVFQVVDQFNILIEAWDEDSVGEDDLIGATTLSLLPVYRYGYLDNWIPIYIKDKFNGKSPAGQLHLELSFVGSPGIAFPQHQVGMDRYDEKQRRTKETVGDEIVSLEQTSAVNPSEYKPVEKATPKFKATRPNRFLEAESEFTDDEIVGAFKFIDLDKNEFIGAAELRHLLICMGELITDEEVDEMIKLCDTDGDGQVSFEEFRRMAVHPDPSSPDFAISAADDNASDDEKDDDETKAKQQEIKDQKMRLMKRFCEDNNPSLDLLSQIFQKYRTMRREQLDFDDFCMLFDVQPTGEYRRLFTLFSPDGTSTEGADLREILLSMVNFMDATDRATRVKFCFEIFDDDKNGFLTEDELVNILKANYMTTPDRVKKKAQTIMKQADDNGDNKMSLDEFYAIAKRFPNLLFPTIASNESI